MAWRGAMVRLENWSRSRRGMGSKDIHDNHLPNFGLNWEDKKLDQFYLPGSPKTVNRLMIQAEKRSHHFMLGHGNSFAEWNPLTVVKIV